MPGSASYAAPSGTEGHRPNTIDIKSFIDERRISAFQWFLVAMCFFVVVADGMDVAIMGFVTPSILQEWDISRPAFGLVISAAPFGLVVGALVAGPSSDRIGLFPDNFIGAAMLPQSPGVDPKTCIPELEKCVTQYGFVGINLNPDPSGGWWKSPPLPDRHWYPIYEKMVEYDIPAMIHVSTSCNPCFHTTGAHYLNADTTAVMQLIEGDLFRDFPTLRFVIPHGGGAAPYHWGRYRGLAQALKKPELHEHLLKNVFFDTCVYHQPGIDLLTRVIPVENVLFASEMVGAVRGVDPETGHNYDDTRRYIEGTLNLDAQERRMIYELNARRVYPRLDAALKARGR